jgi:hypothetical protein
MICPHCSKQVTQVVRYELMYCVYDVNDDIHDGDIDVEECLESTPELCQYCRKPLDQTPQEHPEEVYSANMTQVLRSELSK